MMFLNKFVKIRCFMIVISCICDRVYSYKFWYMEHIIGLLFCLGDLILEHVMCVKF
jgi:hypothetical protein